MQPSPITTASAPSTSTRTRGLVLLACLACVCTHTDAASVSGHGRAHGRKLLFGPVQPPQYRGCGFDADEFGAEWLYPVFGSVTDCGRTLKILQGLGIASSSERCTLLSGLKVDPDIVTMNAPYDAGGREAMQSFADNMNKIMPADCRLLSIK